MKEENKISVVINTYNAEKHLQAVIDAVKGFDEVLICDMESIDSTLEIAQKNGCRIVTFPKGEIRIVEPARQFAIEKAQYLRKTEGQIEPTPHWLEQGNLI